MPVKKKKPVKTISLDPLGKPIFPIKLGDITIHCIGEVTIFYNFIVFEILIFLVFV